MKKILVTGALGQLGSELKERRGKNKSFIFSDIRADQSNGIVALDICDADAVLKFLKDNGIAAVINCAAYTNVNRAESEPELCRRINVDGPVNLARAVKACGASLVQISTDYVFDGKRSRGAYGESHRCHPESVYGATKRRAEVLIRRTGCKGVIIRTAWLYSSYGNNFVKTMLNLAATRDSIDVVADQWGSPTYAADLAEAILKMLPSIDAYRGEIFHFTDEGVCCWADFAAQIMVYAGLGCRINPITTEQYPTPARRPAYSVLDKSLIRDTFSVETPWWTVSLKKMLKKLSEQ